MSGTRLWPPASTFASSPEAASAASVEARSGGRSYSNAAGFTRARGRSPSPPLQLYGHAGVLDGQPEAPAPSPEEAREQGEHRESAEYERAAAREEREQDAAELEGLVRVVHGRRGRRLGRRLVCRRGDGGRLVAERPLEAAGGLAGEGPGDPPCPAPPPPGGPPA